MTLSFFLLIPLIKMYLHEDVFVLSVEFIKNSILGFLFIFKPISFEIDVNDVMLKKYPII